MKIRLTIKSLTIFTLITLLIFFIGYIAITKNYAFQQQISKFIPIKVINYSKKTIFFIYEFKKEIASLNRTIRNKNKKIESKNEVINYFVEEYIFDPTSSVSLIKEENLNKYISLDSQDPEIWEMFSKYFGKHKVNIYFNKMNENEVIKSDIGRYGPYLKCGKNNRKISAPDDVLSITLERAIELFATDPKQGGVLKNLGQSDDLDIVVKDGRYGIYVTNGKVNVTLPKDIDYNTLELSTALELIKNKKPKKRFSKSK